MILICPQRTKASFLNSFVTTEWQWPKRMAKWSTCQISPSWKTRMCPTFMSWRPRGLSSHKATEEGVVCPETVSTGTLPTRGPSTSMITTICPLRSCLPPCTTAILRPAGQLRSLEGKRPVRFMQRKPADTPVSELLGQQPNARVEADMLVNLSANSG